MLAATRGLSADQWLEDERTNCAPAAARHGSVDGGGPRRPVVAARLARVHGWHASPHGGSGAFCLAAAAPRLDRLAAMPRLARDATLDGGSTPCPACFATGNYIALILIHSAFLYILHIMHVCISAKPRAAA